MHAIDIHLNKMKIVLNRVDTLVSFWEASQESLLGPQNGSCPQGKAQGQNQAESGVDSVSNNYVTLCDII